MGLAGKPAFPTIMLVKLQLAYRYYIDLDEGGIDSEQVEASDQLILAASVVMLTMKEMKRSSVVCLCLCSIRSRVLSHHHQEDESKRCGM